MVAAVAIAPALEAVGLSCHYDGARVLSEVDLRVGAGEFVGLIGPNGAGKTTLLRVLAGALAPTVGVVRLQGQQLRSLARRQIALRMAVVPQMEAPPFEFTVREVVQMGRTPHLGRLQWEGARDRAAVGHALRLADLTHLAERAVTELSGGELQRVSIARALAQDAPIMLLDEPAAFLDLGHQAEVFELLARLNREEGRTILCVSHDLNLAARYCRRLVLLVNGRIMAVGSPAEVLSRERIAVAYGAEVEVDAGPGGFRRVTLLGGRPRGSERP